MYVMKGQDFLHPQGRCKVRI